MTKLAAIMQNWLQIFKTGSNYGKIDSNYKKNGINFVKTGSNYEKNSINFYKLKLKKMFRRGLLCCKVYL